MNNDTLYTVREFFESNGCISTTAFRTFIVDTYCEKLLTPSEPVKLKTCFIEVNSSDTDLVKKYKSVPISVDIFLSMFYLIASKEFEEFKKKFGRGVHTSAGYTGMHVKLHDSRILFVSFYKKNHEYKWDAEEFDKMLPRWANGRYWFYPV